SAKKLATSCASPTSRYKTTPSNTQVGSLRSAENGSLFSLGHKDVQTRVNQERGKLTLAKTGNIVGAAWLHTTSRPVEGYPDPNLHVHCFAINATHTGERWTAADFSAIVADSGYYDAIFKSQLATNLREMGYQIERNKNGFEVAGVKRSTIDKFSRRTKEIEEVADRLGITDPKKKGELGAITREAKASSVVPANQLHDKWLGLMSQEERALFSQLKHRKNLPPKKRSLGEVLEYVNQHCFERHAVVREREVARNALLHGVDSFSPQQLLSAVQEHAYFRDGKDEKAVVTTREVLQEEQSLLSFVRSGMGRYRPLAVDHEFKQDWLSKEQKAAVRGILNSHDRLIVLRGAAGSGKTSVMHETIDAIEAGGRSVTVLAPTAQAAHDVLGKQEGFNAHTLASFLESPKFQKEAAKGLIWVDEGALVGTRDLVRLSKVADELDARIILSGDAKQHQPVAAGAPFRLLEDELGVRPFEINTIRRQKNSEYRSAVQHLSRGDVADGLSELSDLGYITEIEDAAARYSQLAADYANNLASGKSTLVIAPSHAEREVVTEAIRSELKTRGIIDSNERILSTLQSKHLTTAERSDPVSYVPGDIVEFTKRGKGGFKPGERLEVSSIENGRVQARMGDRQVEIPIGSPNSFDVYRKIERSFAKGDVIRITKNRKPSNSKEQRLNNGTTLQLMGFTRDGDLRLSNGQILSSSWQHIDHGIVLTSYSSQGKTFDRAIVAQSHLSYAASSPEQLYVTASRAKEQTMIYTDDVPSLFAAVSKQRPNMNASELVRASSESTNTRKPHSLAAYAEHIRLHVRSFAREQAKRIIEWTKTRQSAREMTV
ncbi:MAG: AAA family ATPase, partial [Pirellulaceae bacterium]|nr:AAA family ATPase [Pirellulaceae bacterium]